MTDMTMTPNEVTAKDPDLIKVTFEGDEWMGDGGPGSEGMWARRVGGNLAAIDNVPFFAYGVSIGDIVWYDAMTDPDGGKYLRVQRVTSRSGYRTYRALTTEEGGVDRLDDIIRGIWPEAKAEGGFDTLYVFALPEHLHPIVSGVLAELVGSKRIAAWETTLDSPAADDG